MSGRQLPTCTHDDQPVHERACWPVEYNPEEAHASTYVCEKPGCKEEAAAWVLAVTGHEAVIVPLGGHS